MSNEYFKLTPVSEKPEKEGYYFIHSPENPEEGSLCYFWDGDWYIDKDDAYDEHHFSLDCDGYYYLRPVSLQMQDGEAELQRLKGQLEILEMLHHTFPEEMVIQRKEKMVTIKDLTQATRYTRDVLAKKQPTPTVTTQAEGIIEAAKDLLNSKFWQYKAGNGRMISVEDSSGEKCWIVPDEKIQRLQDAVEQPASLPAAAGPGEERLCVFCGLLCNPAPTERGWVDVPYNKGLHFDCARKVVATGNRIDEVEKSAALQLAGGQSAGVWVTDKLPPTGMIKSYFCKLWSEHLKQEYRGLILFNKTGWAQTEYKILAWLDESLQPATTGEATDDAIEFANWLAKNQWQGSTLFHEPVQLWQQHDYDRELDKYTMSKEFTSEDLYSVFRKEIGTSSTTSPNATERQEGEKDYAEFQEWRKGVIPGTNGTGTDLYFYWLNNIKTNQ